MHGLVSAYSPIKVTIIIAGMIKTRLSNPSSMGELGSLNSTIFNVKTSLSSEHQMPVSTPYGTFPQADAPAGLPRKHPLLLLTSPKDQLQI